MAYKFAHLVFLWAQNDTGENTWCQSDFFNKMNVDTVRNIYKTFTKHVNTVSEENKLDLTDKKQQRCRGHEPCAICHEVAKMTTQSDGSNGQ